MDGSALQGTPPTVRPPTRPADSSSSLSPAPAQLWRRAASPGQRLTVGRISPTVRRSGIDAVVASHTRSATRAPRPAGRPPLLRSRCAQQLLGGVGDPPVRLRPAGPSTGLPSGCRFVLVSGQVDAQRRHLSRRPGAPGVDSRPHQLSCSESQPNHPRQRLSSLSMVPLKTRSPSTCPSVRKDNSGQNGADLRKPALLPSLRHRPRH